MEGLNGIVYTDFLVQCLKYGILFFIIIIIAFVQLLDTLGQSWG